jgi:hypothetical protein
MSNSYWNSVTYPLQKHTGRKKTWQKFTHIFFVTHWGASVSRNPGPASSRTTPLKRQIRSCTPKQRTHFNWPGTHFIWQEMQKKGAMCIHMYKDLITIKVCCKLPKFNDSMLQAYITKRNKHWKQEYYTSIMRTTEAWPWFRAISNGVMPSSFAAKGSATQHHHSHSVGLVLQNFGNVRIAALETRQDDDTSVI